MIKSGEQSERHNIPRWNSVFIADITGESNPLKYKDKSELICEEKKHLEKLLIDWKSEKSITLAVEIISCNRILDNSYDIAMVEDYINTKINGCNNIPQILIDFIQEANQGAETVKCEERDFVEISKSGIRNELSNLKRELILYPRDPLKWCELARNYLLIGQEKQCEKALRVAINLAPNSRAILRAMARFYVHIDDTDRSLYYLRRCPLVKYDPWILSAEISISNVSKRTSKFIKIGQQMIENSKYQSVAISELASELGTMDFTAANSKKGKHKVEIAKRFPSENAAAQMAWINQKLYKIDSILYDMPEPQFNFEANAKKLIFQEKWEEAVISIKKWQDYQPFSKVPAMEGSYLSADLLDDPNTAIEIIKKGMISNPNDMLLLNNYVYSLIISGKLDEANVRLKEVSENEVGEEERILLTATAGLLHYRQNDPYSGALFYQKAINQASKTNRLDLAYRAIIYFAREEKRLGRDISQLLAEIDNPRYATLKTINHALINKFGIE